MGEFLEIKISRCRLFLTETEIISLLARDPELWRQALKRGKGIIRTRGTERREVKIKGGCHGTLHKIK